LSKKSSKIELCALKVLKVTEFLCVYFEILNQGWPIYDKIAGNYPNYRKVSEFWSEFGLLATPGFHLKI
jgi:hypothetical protein